MVGAASQICRFERIPSFRHAAPDDVDPAYIPICPPRAGRVYLWAGHQSGIPGDAREGSINSEMDVARLEAGRSVVETIL